MQSRSIAFSLFLLAFLGCGKKLPVAQKLGALKGGNCLELGTVVSIMDDHGHKAPKITAQMVAAKGPPQIIVGRGAADHEHVLDISASEYDKLNANIGFETQTTVDASGHQLNVVINCQSRYIPQNP